MGWVSLLEDKLERLNSDLDQIRRTRPTRERRKSHSVSEAERHLDALIRVCEMFMRDIRKHLELATDPEVDLADEFLEERKENQILRDRVRILDDTQTKVSDLSSQVAKLRKDFDTANGRAGKHYAELEECRRRYKHLEKEHVRLKRGKGVR
jgi:chromosome segregation ATPase